MNIPESMKAELALWNNGAGIDLESWIGGTGNYSLAVGYTSIFWPEFMEFEGYILRKGFSMVSFRSFATQADATRQSVERAMNHLHITDIHYGGTGLSKDKVISLGNTLKEIYQAKLAWQFPDKACSIEFYQPLDSDNLAAYQLSFWQS